MGTSRDQYLNKYHQAVAEADRLWWVNIIDPDGVDLGCHGGGTSLAEAVAVAWINTCIPAWWSRPDLSDDDYARVPSHVGDGWRPRHCLRRQA